jgi:hypothetical protein
LREGLAQFGEFTTGYGDLFAAFKVYLITPAEPAASKQLHMIR